MLAIETTMKAQSSSAKKKNGSKCSDLGVSDPK